MQEAKPTVSVTPLVQQQRNPSVFKGEAGEDPSKWLKEYERVAKYNRWTDMVCLANTFFFLDGTAKQWFENNEDQLTSWDIFGQELMRTFGDTASYARRAENLLKCRAQKPGEETQSYIQSVLGLCHEANATMPEHEKVGHLMKGVAENIYQALVIKEISTTTDFIKWCQYIESMQQRRIKPHRFERLPNVVPMAAVQDQSDLVGLIRQIIREEVQHVLAPIADEPDAQPQSIEAIIRDEVGKALAPVSEEGSTWTPVRPRRQTVRSDAARGERPKVEYSQRKTDVWRTPDNRPVCFHSGRPGHVARYCRERKAIFDAYRANRRDAFQPRSSYEDHSRSAARSSSQSPARGRSPSRRYRSPSPFRRYSQSPSRPNEEN